MKSNIFKTTLDKSVTDFFESKGYKYGWDTHGGTPYHEIFTSDGKRVMQFCAHCPLESLIEDLICIRENREPTSNINYIINASDGDPNFQELLEKI